MRKVVSMILCLVMVFAVSIPAFADGLTAIKESSIPCAESTNSTNSMSGYVSGSNINFRKDHNLSCDSWCYLQDGDAITILELYSAYEDGYWWTKAQAKGYTGYIASKYVHYY